MSGAVGVGAGAVLALASLVLFLLLSIRRTSGDLPSIRPYVWVLAALGGLVALAALQLVPLPWERIRFLRPVHAELFESLGVGDRPTTISLNPFHTRTGLGHLASAFVAFTLATVWVRRISHVHLILLSYVGIASVVALFGILQALSGDQIPLYQFTSYSHGRARGPFVSPNHFSGYLEMAAPIAISYLFFSGYILRRRMGAIQRSAGPSGRLARKAIIFLAVALIGAGILRSHSRMGIFSLAASVGLLALLLRTRGVKGLLWIGGAVLAVGGMAALIGLEPQWDRLRFLADLEGTGTRLTAWQMTIGVIRDFPIFGTGLRTFQDISAIYQPEGVKGWYGESHNDYLNIVSDLGIIGGSLIVAAGLLWIRKVRDGWRAVSRGRRPLLAGCLASIFAVMLHEVVDFNLQIPGNLFHFALIAGLAVAIPRIGGIEGEPRPAGRGRKVLIALMVLASLLVGWRICRFLIADSLLAGGGEAQLERAQRLDRLRSEIPYRLGRILEEDGRTREARAAFDEALRRDPLSGQAHYKTGLQERRLGEGEVARRRFERALRVAPNNPDLIYRVASWRLEEWASEATKGEFHRLRMILDDFRRAGLLSATYGERGLDRIHKRIGKQFPDSAPLYLARPATAAGHRALGRLLARRGLWKEAIGELESWSDLAVGGDKGRAFIALGVARAKGGDAAGAREAFSSGVETAAGERKYLQQVFDGLKVAGLAEVGIPLWRQQGAESPALQAEMQVLEARAQLLADRPEYARTILEGLLEGRLSGEAFFWLFRLEEAAGAPVTAELHIRRAVTARPLDPMYRHHLAIILEKNGKVQEALREARHAERLGPRESLYSSNRARLERRLAGQE